ncbi:MAG: hypothetical protein ACKORK_14765, partial [Gemmatimonadota bacterium]
TIAEALDGADVFVGLSVAGAVTGEMVARMAKAPIIFALANPVPEILPHEVRAVRVAAIFISSLISVARARGARQVGCAGESCRALRATPCDIWPDLPHPLPL